jgi:hypothetical protein
MTLQNSIGKNLVEGTIVSLTGSATGDIYYRDDHGLFVRLPIGTTGQVLIVGSGLPAWQTLNVAVLGADGKIDPAVLHSARA